MSSILQLVWIPPLPVPGSVAGFEAQVEFDDGDVAADGATVAAAVELGGDAADRDRVVEVVSVAEAVRGAGCGSRACAVVQADPPRGLRLLDTGDQLTLVSAPACAANVERYLGTGPPEAPSSAALEVLAIVAYEQPVTRADIRSIRGVDSDGPMETLMARKLIAEDPRFGGRGRPSFLVTTELFLRRFGLGSLSDLPPRPGSSITGLPALSRLAFPPELADGDNQHSDWAHADGY